MPMDALFLSAVLRETDAAVTGGRIDKIYQPSRDEIILQIRGREGTCRLLLSANPARPRLQLTRLNWENPAQPPMFCMLLRKYLSGGKILALRDGGQGPPPSGAGGHRTEDQPPAAGR